MAGRLIALRRHVKFIKYFFFLTLFVPVFVTMGCQFKKSEGNQLRESADKKQQIGTQIRDTATGKTIYELAGDKNSLLLESFLKSNPEIDVNIEGEDARTPLEIAIRSGYYLNVSILLKKGALPQRPSADGTSLLTLSASNIKVHEILEDQTISERKIFQNLIKQGQFNSAEKYYTSHYFSDTDLENQLLASLFSQDTKELEASSFRAKFMRSDIFSECNVNPAIKYYSANHDKAALSIAYSKLSKQTHKKYHEELKSLVLSMSTDQMLLNFESSSYWADNDVNFLKTAVQESLNKFNTLTINDRDRLIRISSASPAPLVLDAEQFNNYTNEKIKDYFSQDNSIDLDENLVATINLHTKLSKNFSCYECILSLMKLDPDQKSTPFKKVITLLNLNKIDRNFFSKLVERGTHFIDFEKLANRVNTDVLANQNGILLAALELPYSELELFYLRLRKTGNTSLESELNEALKISFKNRWKGTKNSYETSKSLISILQANKIKLNPSFGYKLFEQELVYCTTKKVRTEPLLSAIAKILNEVPTYIQKSPNRSNVTSAYITPTYYFYLYASTQTVSIETENAVLEQLIALYPSTKEAIKVRFGNSEVSYSLFDMLSISSLYDVDMIQSMNLGSLTIPNSNIAYRYLINEFRARPEGKNLSTWLHEHRYLQRALEGEPDSLSINLITNSFKTIDADFTSDWKTLPKIILNQIIKAYSERKDNKLKQYVDLLEAVLRSTNPRLFVVRTPELAQVYLKIHSDMTFAAFNRNKNPLCTALSSSSRIIEGIGGSNLQLTDENIKSINEFCIQDLGATHNVDKEKWLRDHPDLEDYREIPYFILFNWYARRTFATDLQMNWIESIQELDKSFKNDSAVATFLNKIPRPILEFDMAQFKQYYYDRKEKKWDPYFN